MPIIRRPNVRKDFDSGIYVTRQHLLELRHSARLAIPSTSVPISSLKPGESPSRRRGQGMEFEEVRPYQPGDEIRHIDWRVTARMAKPYTRQYTEPKQSDVFIAVDQRVNMFFGSGICFKSWLAAVLSVQFGWRTVLTDSRLGAAVIADRVKLVSTRSGRVAMFDFIDSIIEANQSLSAKSDAASTLTQLLSETYASTAHGSHTVVVSDFHDLDATCASLLTAIGNKGSLTLLWIVDPLEENLPAAGWVGVSNGIDRARRRLNSATRSRYRRRREAFESTLIGYAGTANAELRKLGTGDRETTTLFDRIHDG